MVTLHLLEYLAQNGFGTLDTDLFFGKVPLDKTGVAIFPRGGETAYGRGRSLQRFDLYSRGVTDIQSAYKLEQIRLFFSDTYDELCDLPTITGVSNIVYKKARITEIDNIETIGLDDSDRLIFRLGAQVIYEKFSG